MEYPKGQIEQIFQELGEKIDLLIDEAKGATGELRDNLEEKIEGFKQKKRKLESEYEAFRNKHESK